MPRNKYLIVISGPTAVGKTSLSIDLAKRYKTEIISADSRQFFKELEIGTAKPSTLELQEVKHHFIDNLSINEPYDAGKFAQDAEARIQDLFLEHDHIFVVGGSGLYIKALCDGLDEMPEVLEHERTLLNQQLESKGIEVLLAELKENDPGYYDQVDKQNPQRVIRALEVIRSTHKPYSFFRKGGQKAKKNYKVIKIGLEDDRQVLYDRINRRMDQMIEAGLFAEAEKFYPLRNIPALQTVGYSEIFKYMDGEYDKNEAIRLLNRNSRRYAKRQLTWFKKDEEFEWFGIDSIDQIIDYIQSTKKETN